MAAESLLAEFSCGRDWPCIAMTNMWDDLHGEQDPIYVVQTNRKALMRCMLMTTDPGDLGS